MPTMICAKAGSPIAVKRPGEAMGRYAAATDTADVSTKANASVWSVMARFVLCRPGRVGLTTSGAMASTMAIAAITPRTTSTVLEYSSALMRDERTRGGFHYTAT